MHLMSFIIIIYFASPVRLIYLMIIHARAVSLYEIEFACTDKVAMSLSALDETVTQCSCYHLLNRIERRTDSR